MGRRRVQGVRVLPSQLRRLLPLTVAVTVLGACGAPRPPGSSEGCPEGMARVDSATCMDRWEASLVEVLPDGERPFSPYTPVAGHHVRAVSRRGVVPQAYVSRNDAQAACGASSKRLCREDEWVKACTSARGNTYPYGREREGQRCNDHGRAPLPVLFAGTGVNPYGDQAMNDPRLNQVSGTVSPTGAHERCMTEQGVFDLVGNLHEWVDDPQGTFLGGYYLDTKLNGPGCRYKTTAHGPAYHDYSTGFRCCRDPQR